ncbi:MAG: RNA polymerase sigma factor [Romboutsia sp.]|uniref:RNA polymerase sigma factor n=1 Tax=Romboutsia sp. TaxID=1965302 RepID=UPI003F343874
MVIYLSMIENDEDIDRFENLYNRYKQLMFYIANQILGDEHLSEDAVHISFIKIAKNINKINNIDSRETKSFITVLTKRTSIDIYRKNKKENVVSFEEHYLDNNLEIACDLSDDSDSFIVEAISKLSDTYKEVFILKYRHDLSNKEISKVLNISKDNVEKRIQRGKKKLQNILIDTEACKSGQI